MITRYDPINVGIETDSASSYAHIVVQDGITYLVEDYWYEHQLWLSVYRLRDGQVTELWSCHNWLDDQDGKGRGSELLKYLLDAPDIERAADALSMEDVL